jgi:hypothetical protein
MTALVARPNDERQRRRSSDEREFRLLVALTFPIFLVVVLANALIGKRPIAHGMDAKPSIFAEVKAAASTAIALGFMG